MRLYYHCTDGGAEYLSSERVPGTVDEGAFRQPDGSPARYMLRIDRECDVRLMAHAEELEAALLEAYSLLCSIADYDYWDEDEQDVATIRRAEAALLAARPLTA